MNEIHVWTLVLCTSVMVCCIFEMMSPNGKMQPIMRFVLGMFLICAMVAPFLKINFDLDTNFKKFELKEENNKELTQTIEEQTIFLAKTQMQDFIKEKLAQENIELLNLEIFMNMNGENSITINNIEATIKNKNDKKILKAKEIIKENIKSEKISIS
ncbi:MAG: stage III sporulation protein AF [Oscillospiraceae bacterium]|nr:stage III sporulation protein AF [Oscillospiraceae bacterium]